MRIKINFSNNTSIVPVQNYSLLNSYIHTCLGQNNKYHDVKNDYSISCLYGGRLNGDKKTITFTEGGYFVVSSLNSDFINNMLIGVINNPILFSGMVFSGVDHIKENFYDGWNHFTTLSPFLIKKYSDKKTYKFLTLNDDNFELLVKEYLINKINRIDSKLNYEHFDVVIPNLEGNRVKSILVKNVINKANKCQISIFCSKKIAELLYNIGIDQSTGSGFGTIYKTENHSIYKLGYKK